MTFVRAHARRVPMVGMYAGYGGHADITAWSDTNGVPVQLGHEFGDSTQWSYFETGTLFDEWAPWVAARLGRRFSYSAPLLTVSDSGANQAAKYASLAAGTFDSHFTTLGGAFQSYPELRNSIVRLGWEFNGNSRAWAIPPSDATTLANFKTGWNRAAAALKAACPTLKIEWCPNIQYDYTNESFANLWPGGTYVDYVGIGAYDYYWPSDGTVYTPFATRWAWLRDGDSGGGNGLAAQVALAQANGKELAHTEWGLWRTSDTGIEGGGDDPEFIDALADWHQLYGYAYSIYNNTVSDGGHSLATYANARRRFTIRHGHRDPAAAPAVGSATFRSISTGGAFPSTSYDITKPAGTASGDVLVALQVMDEGGTLADMTSDDFEQVAEFELPGYGYYKVWMRPAGGSEPSTYGFGGNAGGGADVAIVCLSSAAAAPTVMPVWVDGTVEASTSHSTPDIAVPTGALRIDLVNVNRFGVGSAVTHDVASSGLTERADFDNTYSAQWVGTQAGATSGTRTITASASFGSVGMSMAIGAA